MTLMYPIGCTVIISQPIMGVYNVGVKFESPCGVPKLGASDSATTMASEGSEARHTFFPIPFYINPHYKPPRPSTVRMPSRKCNSLSSQVSRAQAIQGRPSVEPADGESSRGSEEAQRGQDLDGTTYQRGEYRVDGGIRRRRIK